MHDKEIEINTKKSFHKLGTIKCLFTRQGLRFFKTHFQFHKIANLQIFKFKNNVSQNSKKLN